MKDRMYATTVSVHFWMMWQRCVKLDVLKAFPCTKGVKQDFGGWG